MQPIIFGGKFMAQLDLCAAQCVRRCLQANNSPCRQAVTHQMNFKFLQPCYVGDTIDMVAEITGARNKSIAGQVTAYRLNPDSPELEGVKVAEAQFVFITVGELDDLQSKPRYLPYKDHGLPSIEGQ